MCLCPSKAVDDIAALFDSSVSLQAADDMPIGHMIHDDHGRGQAYLLTVNGCSCDLFRGGHRMDARPDLVMAGIDNLLKHVGQVNVMVHWYTDTPDRQSVRVCSERRMNRSQFKKILSELEEDIRYIVNS